MCGRENGEFFLTHNCLTRCQNLGWKDHKKSCRSQGQGQQLSLDDIRTRVADATESGDSEEVLRWLPRFDELMKGPDRDVAIVCGSFATTYERLGQFDKAGPLFGRMSELCGALKMFDWQAMSSCSAGGCFMRTGDEKNAALW